VVRGIHRDALADLPLRISPIDLRARTHGRKMQTMTLGIPGEVPAVKAVEPNESAIAALPARGAEYEVSVYQHRCLVVRVSPNGRKRFVYRRRLDGRLRRDALRATDLVGAVREWAARMRDANMARAASRRKGRRRVATPVRRRYDARDPTIAQLLDRYMAERAEPQKRSSRVDYNMLAKYFLPAWGEVKVKALRRGDVHALVTRISRNPLQANRMLAAVRKLFAFSVETGVLAGHACLACPVTHCVIENPAAIGLDAESADCSSDRGLPEA